MQWISFSKSYHIIQLFQFVELVSVSKTLYKSLRKLNNNLENKRAY